MKTIFLFCFFISLICISCKETKINNTNPKTLNYKDYFPPVTNGDVNLSTSYEWIYVNTKPDTLTVKVTGKKTFGNKSYFIFNYLNSTDRESINKYYRADENGNIYYYDIADNKDIMYIDFSGKRAADSLKELYYIVK